MAAPMNKNTMTDIPPDTFDPGLAFINMLTAGESSYDQGYQFSLGYTGDSVGDISFDPAPPQHIPSFSNSNIDPSLFVSILEPPSVDQVPNLSPNSNSNCATTPDSTDNSLSSPSSSRLLAPTTETCAHTSALYLALDSMQKVPEDIEGAIRHARRAARSAYDVVYCPVCSFKIEPPPAVLDGRASADIMRNFQNLMLLAALIPSIVHAYERILRTVDEETRRATAERRSLVFKLRGFGGIMWGNGSSSGGSSGGGGVDKDSTNRCDAASSTLNHREMEPAMWRLTVRALLKADVYGLTDMDAESAEEPLQIGLKDIVLQLEQKSKARHALMDALMSAGAWKPPNNCGFPVHVQGETPTCQKVIAIAKASIDALVIA
ncbi:hypothetical protein M426DRAFT_319314 [Hypoxylon sp. CI-4A]|nr:hypothetical protein M426DRAFT_319314 [Hypoxylon sp. CI-4A]